MDQKIFIFSQDNQRLEDEIESYQYEKEQFKKTNYQLKELLTKQNIRLGNLEKISLAKETKQNFNFEKHTIHNQKNTLVSFLKKYNIFPN